MGNIFQSERFVAIHHIHIPANRLIFGTASLHKIFSRRERVKLLRCAYDVGFRHFDLCGAYGGGIANATFREALSGNHEVLVSSKIGLDPRVVFGCSTAVYYAKRFLSKKPLLVPIDDVLPDLENRLSREKRTLGRESIDFLFLHEPYDRFMADPALPEWVASGGFGSFQKFGIAGPQHAIEPWLKFVKRFPLSIITQTKDSLEQREADFLEQYGRRREFTYGYFGATKAERDTQETLASALNINHAGKVLYSTLSCDRLEQLRLG